MLRKTTDVPDKFIIIPRAALYETTKLAQPPTDAHPLRLTPTDQLARRCFLLELNTLAPASHDMPSLPHGRLSTFIARKHPPTRTRRRAPTLSDQSARIGALALRAPSRRPVRHKSVSAESLRGSSGGEGSGGMACTYRENCQRPRWPSRPRTRCSMGRRLDPGTSERMQTTIFGRA